MTQIVWHSHKVTKQQRSTRLKQSPRIIWFTGLSGSGKSTLAGALEERLFELGYQVFLLDGDNVRHGLCRDLSFSDQDREENIRRIGEVGKLMIDAGLIVLAAFISPFKKDRAIVRSLVEPHEFIEVFVNAPLSVCEQRDPKGLYKRARSGEIKNFTGIDSVYEPPDEPEIIINTDQLEFNLSLEKILEFLKEHDVLTEKKIKDDT